MPLEFMSRAEVEGLTRRKRHQAQCRALAKMGVPYRDRPGEYPAVLRSKVEALLGGPQPAPKTVKGKEPDWSALNAA
jgi:hypothetical protein